MIVRTSGAVERAERVGFAQARALMLRHSEPLASEIVRLDEAHGRIAAATLFAEDDLMPFARSAMDGYAVRAADTVQRGDLPVVLPVGGYTSAADRPLRLSAGHALAVATGAPLPRGADAVVPVEDVIEREGRGEIELSVELRPGDHVFGCGDDAKRGDALVRHGDVVTPGRAALLAAAGHAAFRVHRRPRVSIVCAGDEIVAVNERPGAGQVRNSNAAMLAGQVVRDGAHLVSCAQAPDSERVLRAVLRTALNAADLIITTGGASAGERDFVKRTLTELGTQFLFRSVALRPAKLAAFGECGAALVAALPGNPAAAFVGYSLLVRGLVRRLGGYRDAFPAAVDARLEGSVHAKSGRHFVAFAHLRYERGAFAVRPLHNQCSALVRTPADANALIVVPPGEARSLPGDTVRVEVPDWSAVVFT